MNCRKCGAKWIARRKAGVFSCRHCGIQPDGHRLERGGLPIIKAMPESIEPQPEERTIA